MSKLTAFLRRHKKAELALGEAAATTAGFTVLKRFLVAGVAAAAVAVPAMIDLSNNNGPGAVAAISSPGVHLVEAKATEGLGFHDYLYPTFRTAATKYHKAFGGYMFLHPDASGAAQADYFLAYAQPHRGDIQPVVDSEMGTACASAPATLAALHELVAKGYHPILYSNTYWLGQLATCAPALKAFPVWQAEYGPTLHRVAGFHVIAWQYTDAANVNGAHVDGSQLFVSVTSLEIAPPKPLTPAQKLARRKAALRAETGGFWVWRSWREGIGEWKGLGHAAHDARPNVRRHVPLRWWEHLHRLHV